MSGTGENEVGLRKILDFTRLAAIAILMLHFTITVIKLLRNGILQQASATG